MALSFINKELQEVTFTNDDMSVLYNVKLTGYAIDYADHFVTLVELNGGFDQSRIVMNDLVIQFNEMLLESIKLSIKNK